FSRIVAQEIILVVRLPERSFRSGLRSSVERNPEGVRMFLCYGFIVCVTMVGQWASGMQAVGKRTALHEHQPTWHPCPIGHLVGPLPLVFRETGHRRLRQQGYGS